MPDFHSDNELITAATAGDEGAMSHLIKSVMPCIEAAASLNAGSGAITRCDLIQEGLMGAVKAIFGFDKSKGVRFSTYAQRCIENSISTAVRNSTRRKQQPLNAYVPLEDVENSLVGNTGNPESVVFMEESVDIIQNCIDTKLTVLEKDVLLLHIAEDSYEQISQKLGITTKAVGNALGRARQKIKAEIGKNS